ncbi:MULTISPECIES: polyphosphate--glucose phosphotransferase [unclassified Brevibacterium]|uniref:polyphosphate--glucose phosphotransferase n=1 Tax=unclassified Brevibacterium TaxID=2614124 RepID=UPI0010F4BE09|nr:MULTISPECIES: ROK family protein [unclassified Brevibacterium]MCM1012334.1 ROK family protein [Brevibacterium sp. XM4083]
MTDDSPARFAIGIDIGGTGIKAALVDTATGQLAFKRVRVLTPKPSTPVAVADAIAEVVELLVERALELEVVDDRSSLDALPLGCGFPGVVRDDEVHYAANLDQSWIGSNIQSILREHVGRRFFIMNDADAAGLAEMVFGAGRKYRKKTVLLTTLGTGIGTALFTQGRLVPYTELGHIEMNGRDAETQAAESVKVREELEYDEWAARLQQYYSQVELLVAPDLIIVGGGISKQHDEFLPLIKTRALMCPAKMFNNAGIVGAAILAVNDGKARVKKGES